MALVYFDGFETGPTYRSDWTMGGPSSSTGRLGVGKSLTNTSGNSATLLLPSPISTCIVGFAAKSATTTFNLITLRGDANATAHHGLRWNGSGNLVLYRGSTALETSASTYDNSVWHWFEMKATIADSGGTFIVKMDGATIFNFTGDTKNGGTLTTVSGLSLGAVPGAFFDDLVVCDATGSAMNDFFGEKVINAKYPSGNGSSSQWVGSDADSTDNYALVDETTWSTTDYVGSATSGNRDLYAMGAVSGLSTVDAIQTHAYASKSDASTKAFKIVTKAITSGAGVTSSSLALGTDWQVFAGDIRTTNPDGNAWTVARANDIEVGVEVV